MFGPEDIFAIYRLGRRGEERMMPHNDHTLAVPQECNCSPSDPSVHRHGGAGRHWLFFCGGSGMKSLLTPLFQRMSSQRGICSLRSLTFVVAVSDDGGSSRALMDSFGGLPVGDCRNIALATADALLSATAQTMRLDEANIASRRSVLKFLTHRLDASDERTARNELADCVMAQCKAQASSGQWERIAAGLSAFLECCSTLTKSPTSDRGLPLLQLDGSLVLRNASVGNLVLFGLLAERIKCRCPSPLAAAVAELLDEICFVKELTRLCGVATITVLPSMEYCYGTSDSSPLALGDVFPLPQVELCGVRRSGRVVRGQRSISYGSRLGSADLSDVYVTEKEPHRNDSREVPSPCDSAAPQFGHNATVIDESDAARVVGAFRLLLIHKNDVANRRGTGSLSVCRSPIVQRLLLDNETELTDVMFARGSLYSSTLAAALPHLAAINAWRAHQHKTLHLMINGSRDRETVAIGSAEEYVMALEGLIQRVLLHDGAVELDDARDVVGAQPSEFEGFDVIWAPHAEASSEFAMPLSSGPTVTMGGRCRVTVPLKMSQVSAAHFYDDNAVAELLSTY